MSITNKKPAPEHTRAIDFVRNLARRYTKHAGHLQVDGGETGGIVVVAMRAHRDDHPRLVGSGGKNISALQWLCARFGDKAGKRVRLTLLDPIAGDKGPLHEFTEDPNWSQESTEKLLREVLGAVFQGAFEVECMRVPGLATFTVKLPGVADPVRAADLKSALHTLFHAIGKNEGQQIHVDVTND